MSLRAGARCGSRLRLLGIVSCLSIWCVTSVASAREPFLPGLAWVRLAEADACISATSLAQRIEDKLGRSVFVPTSAAELTIEGYVAPNANHGFTAHLSAVAMDGRVLGTRDLEVIDAECSELDDALILVIAVTLYPEVGIAGMSMLTPEVQATLDQWLSGSDAPVAAPGPPAAATVQAGRRGRQVDNGSDNGDTPLRDDVPYVLDVALLGGTGMLPTLAVGAEIMLTFQAGLLPIALGIDGFYWRAVAPPINSFGEVSIGTARAFALMCPAHVRYKSIHYDACVGVDGGVFYAGGSGFVFNDTAYQSTFALRANTNLRLMLSDGLGLRFGLTAALPLRTHTVQIRNIGRSRVEVFSVSFLTLAAHVGLVWLL